jgi:hypothetical protein
MMETLFSLFCELPLVIEILTENQNNPRELVTFAAAAPPARAGGRLGKQCNRLAARLGPKEPSTPTILW